MWALARYEPLRKLRRAPRRRDEKTRKRVKMTRRRGKKTRRRDPQSCQVDLFRMRRREDKIHYLDMSTYLGWEDKIYYLVMSTYLGWEDEKTRSSISSSWLRQHEKIRRQDPQSRQVDLTRTKREEDEILNLVKSTYLGWEGEKTRSIISTCRLI